MVSDVFGWTEQGKAFLYINLGTDIIIVLALTVIFIIAGFVTDNTTETNEVSFLVVLVMATGVLAIILFATWGATKLFDIDFYVAYQIMTFGQCLCTNSTKKED